MDSPKPKRGCDRVEVSTPRSVNDTGYNEEPAKYMANPKAGFWKTIKKLFNKGGKTE
jgi:hypothetical protein